MCITWIFATLVPLDEAHYEEDQDEESYGTHQANKPALGGNIYLAAGYSWTHTPDTQRKRSGEKDRNRISITVGPNLIPCC